MVRGWGRGGTRRLAGGLLAAGLVVALGLAGCSAAGNDKSSGAAAPAAAKPGELDSGRDAGVTGQGGAGSTADQAAPGKVLDPAQVPVNGQRSVIYTGSISLKVSDVDSAAGQLSALTIGAGGYVSADERSIDAARSSATVAVRIPAEKFDSVLSQISRLGEEKHRQITAQDVTAQLVDLDSRIKTQQASVDRIRELLAKAQSIAEIASVESELTRREADLESLKAQQAALAGQATLSTITVMLFGPDAVVTKPTPKKQSGFVHGLSAGWHAFTASVGALLTVLGAILPFALVIGVPAWLVVAFLRRRARTRPAVAESRPAPVLVPAGARPVPPPPLAPPVAPPAPPAPPSRSTQPPAAPPAPPARPDDTPPA